ncbi:MAG: hypothetical protein OSA92_15275, partial [Pirellulaceae bacterium]|nr:hypothetical protein [Pirellulaceae bacterium]
MGKVRACVVRQYTKSPRSHPSGGGVHAAVYAGSPAAAAGGGWFALGILYHRFSSNQRSPWLLLST